MKKKLLVTFTVFAFVLISLVNLKPFPIEAKNIKEKEIVNNRKNPTPPKTQPTNQKSIWTQEKLDEYFASMGDDDTLILQMPKGGWIGTIPGTPSEPGVVDAIIGDTEYDIETDPNSETIAEAKKRLLGTPIVYNEE